MNDATAATPILIVEDDPDIRLGISELLDAEGYPVLVARDGMDGWNVLKQNPGVRLVLLDFTMPKLDARGFRELQRSDSALSNIPVILFSAAALPADVIDSLGVTAVVKKPVDIDRLMEEVRRYA